MKIRCIFVIFLALLLSGCATVSFRSHPLLAERIKPVSKIVVMPMDVEVYKVSAGGVRELVDEFTLEAKNNIKTALDNEISQTHNYKLLYLRDLKEVTDTKEKLLFKDALALYVALDTSIITHTYPPNIFKDKLKNFDYTFGPNLNAINSYGDADTLLFIRGGDYLSSGGRVALMVWAAVMGFTPTNAGPPHLSVALVDPKSGDILWYNSFYPQQGYNFRNKDSVSNFVKILLKGFPDKARE